MDLSWYLMAQVLSCLFRKCIMQLNEMSRPSHLDKWMQCQPYKMVVRVIPRYSLTYHPLSKILYTQTHEATIPSLSCLSKRNHIAGCTFHHEPGRSGWNRGACPTHEMVRFCRWSVSWRGAAKLVVASATLTSTPTLKVPLLKTEHGAIQNSTSGSSVTPTRLFGWWWESNQIFKS